MLIAVGNKIINTDNMLHCTLNESGGVEIIFNNASRSRDGAETSLFNSTGQLTLEGQEAKSFWAEVSKWVNKHA